jgi:CRISPR-associated protein Cas1
MVMDLVLNTFGTCLTKDNDVFMGLKQEGKQRIPPVDVRSILVSRGAQISSDAVLLAIEHEIDLLLTLTLGHPKDFPKNLGRTVWR